MTLEIEKKYRITNQQRDALLKNLTVAKYLGEDFEVNTIFRHPVIDLGNAILRLRTLGNSGLLTHKQRLPTSAGIKHQQETETRVDDSAAMAQILETLGFRPALMYEKFRQTWELDGVEVVVDRLPFGLFVEIEGDERAIEKTEKRLGMENFKVEHDTYPQLTLRHGKRSGDLVAAQFDR